MFFCLNCWRDENQNKRRRTKRRSVIWNESTRVRILRIYYLVWLLLDTKPHMHSLFFIPSLSSLSSECKKKKKQPPPRRCSKWNLFMFEPVFFLFFWIDCNEHWAMYHYHVDNRIALPGWIWSGWFEWVCITTIAVFISSKHSTLFMVPWIKIDDKKKQQHWTSYNTILVFSFNIFFFISFFLLIRWILNGKKKTSLDDEWEFQKQKLFFIVNFREEDALMLRIHWNVELIKASNHQGN